MYLKYSPPSYPPLHLSRRLKALWKLCDPLHIQSKIRPPNQFTCLLQLCVPPFAFRTLARSERVGRDGGGRRKVAKWTYRKMAEANGFLRTCPLSTLRCRVYWPICKLIRPQWTPPPHLHLVLLLQLQLGAWQLLLLLLLLFSLQHPMTFSLHCRVACVWHEWMNQSNESQWVAWIMNNPLAQQHFEGNKL